MKKAIIGLLVVIGVWNVLQVPSITQSLYLFLVLDTNPFTNKSVSLVPMIVLLTTVGFISTVLIFSKELNVILDGLLDWILQPRRIARVQLTSKQKPVVAAVAKKLPKPAVLIRTKLAIPKLQYDHDTGWAAPVTAEPIPLPKSKMPRKPLHIRGFIRAARRPFLRVAVKMAVSLAAAELSCLRTVRNAIRLLTRGVLRTWRLVTGLIIGVIVWTLAIGGYILLISSIGAFVVWRVSEPFIRRADQWIADRLHEHEETAALLAVGHGLSQTCSAWWRELRAIKHSIYR
jgi:hypothetical protein